MHSRFRRTLAALTCMAALALATAAGASASIRYAAPGGTGASPCVAASPCSLYNAADKRAPGAPGLGDEVVVEPGEYSSTGVDFGPGGNNKSIELPINISLHGVAGQPRPRIMSNTVSVFGLHVAEGDRVSHLEIARTTVGVDLAVLGGPNSTVIEDVIATGSSSLPSNNEATCEFSGKVVLIDTVCTNSNASGEALLLKAFAPAVPASAKLRNVTAIATGPGSSALSVSALANEGSSLEGKSVIAEGVTHDVLASASGTGSTASITLDHSDFDESQAVQTGGGVATVTMPGSATNILAVPHLDSSFHELADSPTVDKGAVDATSATTDIDGQNRVIGAAADIGADELAEAASLAVACAPVVLPFPGGSTECTATVTNQSPAGSTPGGEVAFAPAVAGVGSFGGGHCTLAPLSATQSSCHLTYALGARGAGAYALEATYLGDSSHDRQTAKAAVTIAAALPPVLSKPVTRPKSTAPSTALKFKPKRRSTTGSARFTFSANQVGSSFECKLDHQPFKRCRSPFKTTVKPGAHSFQVRAVNAAGLKDATPAVFRWTVVAAR